MRDERGAGIHRSEALPRGSGGGRLATVLAEEMTQQGRRVCANTKASLLQESRGFLHCIVGENRVSGYRLEITIPETL